MTDPDLRATQARLAKTEHVFRRINDSVRQVAEPSYGPRHRFEFMCECSDSTCTRHVELTINEYEALRKRADHFAVLPDHERAEVETVVDRTDRFLVVEKIEFGREVARDLDRGRD